MEKSAWFEREEDWVLKRPVIFNKNMVRTTFIEINRLFRLLGDVPAGGNVLDLCCGIGRHSLELARKGFQVTGVDITQPYLDSAAESADRQGLSVEFVHDDMRHFCRPDSFDLVVSLSTSFGYFEEIEDDLKVLDNIYRMLKENGKFTMEVLGKEVIASTFRKDEELEFDGYKVIAQSRILDDWNRLECVRKISKDGKTWDDIYSYFRLYSATELKEHMKNAGFRNIRIYGDFAGSPYNNDAKSMVVIAEK
jgi:ubiquinone/menaquinone biosynthesis C-methylase UbiE